MHDHSYKKILERGPHSTSVALLCFRVTSPDTRVMHVTESLFGVGIVSSDFILGVLRNADASKDADDCNDNQQFDECEA